MAEYINIKGTNRQVVSSDPSNPTIGQIWYNTTSNSLKGNVFQSAAWATGGALGTGRYSRATFGTQDAAVFAGGSPPSTTAATEKYNGTSWTASGNLSVSRRNLAGCGVSTAGLATGGTTAPSTSTSVEEFGGSSWTSGGALPSAIRGHYNLGTQTASVNCGGNADPPSVSVATTIEYNGSSWTSGGAMGHARSDGQGCGVLTASLAVGGRTTNAPPAATPAADTVEEYDGSSWTAGGAYPTAMNALGVAGSQTSAVAFAGNTGGNQSATNTYDGTSFTSSTSLNTARGYASGCGTQAAGLAVGGSSPNTQTEEFTAAGAATVTIDPV